MLPYLVKALNQLEKAGADFVVLPCNTLHSLLPEIKKESKLEVLDLIEEVSKRVRFLKLKTVGILSTTKTREERLYDNALAGIRVLYPSISGQEELSRIIIRIIRKESTPEDKRFIDGLISKLIKSGADKIILACTDLANIIQPSDNILDSTQILIDTVKKRIKCPCQT